MYLNTLKDLKPNTTVIKVKNIRIFLPSELKRPPTKIDFQNENGCESFWLNANDVMSQSKVFRLPLQLKNKAGTLVD